jgi:DNA-binding NarL/FixJ family response regulator
MSNRIRILLADDHPVFRNGLRALLTREPDFEIVAEAGDGEAAIAGIATHRPDVALLDLEMPKHDAFEVAVAVRPRVPSIAIVVFTAHGDEALVNRACDLGIRGYMLKNDPEPEIAACIRAVHAGRVHISARVSGALLNRANRPPASRLALHLLTPTERRVLTMIADQQTSQQIADALFISVRTVDRHRSNLCAKLDLHGPNALTKFAIAHRTEL